VAAKAGKINPAEIASVDLLKKFHTPKATELSNLVLATCLANMAGKIDISAPRHAPEIIQIIKKAGKFPGPIKQVNINVKIASIIPIESTNFNSYLDVNLPQKGTEMAAPTKNVIKNRPANSGIRKRASTKNKKSVDVTATGLAFKNDKIRKPRVVLSFNNKNMV
jgi:hypothetical protein